MGTPKICYSEETETTLKEWRSENSGSVPKHWYCEETGVYSSKHRSRNIPADPFLDVVSFIFSQKHHGVSALVDSSSGLSISYTQLPKMVKSVASGLHERGVSKGQVVLILLPNMIYFPVIYLGIMAIGAIVTPMNPLCSLSEIMKQIKDCNVVLAFTISEHSRKLRKTGVPVVLVQEAGEPDSSSSEYLSFEQIMSSNQDFAPKPRIDQQDTAALLYSSGTSGNSKGVVITHRNLIAAVELFIRFEASQYDELDSENVFLASIPMFHVYGLSLFATGLLSLGSTVVVMKKFDAEAILKAIERYKVTHIPLVPPMLSTLARKKNAYSYDLGSLKQVSCGAAPLSKKLIQEFLQNYPHVDLIQGYGMTETTAVGTRGFNTAKIRKYESIGLLAPNMQAKVVDWNTGSYLSPGKSGELWLRGPAVMKGYLNNAEATSLTIDEDGWLHTGDIVHFDQDGFLYVLDRLKEMIKHKGFQVAPADLEAVLISHPEILDAAVTAAPDEEAGEVPVAYVIRRQGSMLSPAEVINHVAAQVAPYKKVRKVVFINSIPRSPAGKILRRQLRPSGTSRI